MVKSDVKNETGPTVLLRAGATPAAVVGARDCSLQAARKPQ